MSIKPYCCTVCGETDPDNFSQRRKGKCKKCHSARTGVRSGMVRNGTLIPKHHRPKVKPSHVSGPGSAREREVVLRCRCGGAIYNVAAHLIGLAEFVCERCAEREG